LENTTLGRIPKVVAADADKFPDLAAAFHEAVIARGSRLLQAVITRGVRRGEFRPVPVEATAEVLLSSLMMPAIARRSPGFHSGTPVPADQYLSALVELALHGLLSPGRSGQ
jgi:AcrR family transcriptional regulator